MHSPRRSIAYAFGLVIFAAAAAKGVGRSALIGASLLASWVAAFEAVVRLKPRAIPFEESGARVVRIAPWRRVALPFVMCAPLAVPALWAGFHRTGGQRVAALIVGCGASAVGVLWFWLGGTRYVLHDDGFTIVKPGAAPVRMAWCDVSGVSYDPEMDRVEFRVERSRADVHQVPFPVSFEGASVFAAEALAGLRPDVLGTETREREALGELASRVTRRS